VRITAVLTVKNEGAFLLEWLAHHRAVGITDFLVFSNDCADGTDLMLDRLQTMGWLTHVPNPGPFEEGPQWAALKQADRHPLVRAADWLIPFDIDEFINIHTGNRTLPALLAALPQATAIPLTWRMFGNAGVVGLGTGQILPAFTRAAPVPLYWPWRAMMFKTLYRNDGSYRKLGVHRPRNPDPARLAQQRWFDGSGRALPALFHTQRIFSDPGCDPFRLVQLNHYPLGAAEDFLLKCDRGNSFHNGEPLTMDYWVDRNFCDVEDRSILALDSSAALAGLIDDPQLRALHHAALDWRRARLAALLADEGWRALLGRLLMAPPSRVLPKATAEALRRAAATGVVDLG
jgi:hypothetical protein